MSIRDVLKKSFLNSEVFQTSVTNIVLALAAAVLLGALIYIIYKRFYAGVIYSRSFAVTLTGMCVLTCMVTLAISTNVVISLGMVGALSIVRFRTAIKDPMDLLYLFWAITTGITTGAGMYALALATAVIMILLILIFYYHQAGAEIYIAVIHYTGEETYAEILRAMDRMKYYVKSMTRRGDAVELAVELSVKKENLHIGEEIGRIPGVSDVTMIQYNGEYHG